MDVENVCVEYHSSKKENEILPFATIRMDLAGITLSEVSQREKDKCENPKTNQPTKPIDVENILVVSRGRGGRWVKWLKGCKRYKLSVKKMISLFWM